MINRDASVTHILLILKHNHMKKYTVTGYTRTGKSVQPVLTYNAESFTNNLLQNAISIIQMFNVAPLRYDVQEVSL